MRLKFDKISPHRHTGMYDNSTKQFMVSYEIDVNFLYMLDVYDTVFYYHIFILNQLQAQVPHVPHPYCLFLKSFFRVIN